LSAAECPAQWTELVNTNSLNGIRNDAYRTLSACQEYCASVAECVAVDFNFDDRSCWLHVSADNLNDVYDQTNTNQYRIDRDCATGTTTTTTSSSTSFTTSTTTSTTATTTGLRVYVRYSVDVERNNNRFTALCPGLPG